MVFLGALVGLVLLAWIILCLPLKRTRQVEAKIQEHLQNAVQLHRVHQSESLFEAQEPQDVQALNLELERSLLHEVQLSEIYTTAARHHRTSSGKWYFLLIVLLPVFALIAYNATGAWRDVEMRDLMLTDLDGQAPDPQVSSRLIAYLEQQLQTRPNDVMIRHQIGFEQFRAGNIPAALSTFEAILAEQDSPDKLLAAMVERMRGYQQQRKPEPPACGSSAGADKTQDCQENDGQSSTQGAGQLD